MRILAYVNENRFWIDILKALEARGATIACVFGPPSGLGTFHDDIHRAFPNARYHDLYAVNRAEYGEPDLAQHALRFDTAAREVWESDGHQVLDLMSRLDMRDEMSYRDRRDLFREHLRFADFLMQTHRIDSIVSSICLHDPLLFVVSALFRRRGKKIATFMVTNFDARLYPWWSDGTAPEEADVLAAYRHLSTEGHDRSHLSDRLHEEFARIRSADGEAGAADFKYVTNWVRTIEPRTAARWLLNGAILLLRDVRDLFQPERSGKVPFPTRYEKEPRHTLANSFRSPFARMRHALWSAGNRRRVAQLRKDYETRVVPLPQDAPFVFVPLHYQMEMSSSPLGGAFSDQLLLLHTLSAALPAGWQIVVKEHPAQLNPNFEFACAGRRPLDYELMQRVPGVHLVSTKTDQFRTIQRCQAVATITGTSGWEAALRGRPVLAFGDAWYRPCRSVFAVRNVDDCRAALETIKSGFVADPRDAELLVEAIERVGVPPYVGPEGDWAPWVVDGRGESHRAELVKRYADQLALMLDPAKTELASRAIPTS